MKLNVNTDTMINNVTIAELNISVETVFLNIQTLEMIWYNTNIYIVSKVKRMIFQYIETFLPLPW